MSHSIFLHPEQVKEIIKQAEIEEEVVVVRCVRKCPASKPGGPDVGDLYDLHCTSKPKDYSPVGTKKRVEEDDLHGVLTVFVTNRKDKKGNWGAWRRVNIEQVKKVIHQGSEYEVVNH